MENKAHVSNRRRELKSLTVSMMGGKCHRCGWNEHQSGLVPHHADPSKKDFSIGGNTRSWERIKKEIRKCFLLCSNCHSVVHATNEVYYLDEKNLPDYPDVVENRRQRRVKNCSDCGKKNIDINAERCRPCYIKQKSKIDWPDKSSLIAMIELDGYSSTARKLGVSDNAVRKRVGR
jgi:hypothetical protein